MDLALVFFVLALAALSLLLLGLIKPGKVFLGKDATRTKISRVYASSFLVLLIAFLVAVPKQSERTVATSTSSSAQIAANTLPQPAQPTPEPAVKSAEPPHSRFDSQPEKTLELSPEAFRKRFNEVIGTIDGDYKAAEFDVKPGPVNNTFQRMLSNNIGLMGTISKKNGEIKELLIMVAGNDKDPVKPIAVLLAAAQAANPHARQEDISNAVLDLTKRAAANIRTGDSSSRIVGPVEYAAAASEMTGLMFTMSPIK